MSTGTPLVKACSKHGRFVIEDLNNPEVTSRWVYSCAEHLGVLVEESLMGSSQVRVHEQCNRLEPTCEYGVE